MGPDLVALCLWRPTLRGGGGRAEGAGAGYSRGVEDEEAPFEQSISVGVSSVSTCNTGLSVQAAHTCDTCGPVLKDILPLPEPQGPHCGLKPYSCGACGKQFWFSANFYQHQEHYNSVETFLRDKGKASFVKN